MTDFKTIDRFIKIDEGYHSFRRFEVVGYHANCTDGIAAAAVALLACNGIPEFVPMQYGQPLPERILKGGKCVLFVDFCPEREQIEQIQGCWKDWLAIDHHKHRDWLPKEFPGHAIFDMERSGAMLTWDFFGLQQDPQPLMIQYVQDRDLWQWKLPDSREISAGLHEEEKTVEHWARLIYANPFDYLSAGKVLLKSRSRAAASLASRAFWVGLSGGGGFMAVNATENVSEVSEEILKRFPAADVACSFFLVRHDTVILSFRSRSHAPDIVCRTALDVAKSFGGGGHTHAAGAQMSLDAWAVYLNLEAHPVAVAHG